MLAGLLNQPCTLHVAGAETVNDYGDPVRTYTDVETVCSLQQQSRQEPGEMGETSVSEWRIYLLPGTELGAAPTANRVTVAGQTFEFAGSPWLAWDPTARKPSHYEATVRQTS